MNTKEFTSAVEEHVEQLVSACSYSQDRNQIQALREGLLSEAATLLKEKLTEKTAFRIGDHILAKARKELRERQKAAARAATATLTLEIPA